MAVEKLGLLASPFSQTLRVFALTCDDLPSLCSRSNLHASRRKSFGHPTSICCYSNLLANGILSRSHRPWGRRGCLKWVFGDLRVLARKLARPFDHPPQVSTLVQLAATGNCLRVHLARASCWPRLRSITYSDFCWILRVSSSLELVTEKFFNQLFFNESEANQTTPTFKSFGILVRTSNLTNCVKAKRKKKQKLGPCTIKQARTWLRHKN